MRTVGIVCEYNPFHTGHQRQIDILHSMGYDCVVCVMSGNYTQRGELAIFDKYTRAESALLGGADLVLELPFPFSSLSAEGFANAGVYILASLGVDAISFGSECGDIHLLCRAAETICSPEFASVYSELQLGGLGSAAAYFEAIKRISGEDSSLLSNDILGSSYISAVKRQNAALEIIPVKREGMAYNDEALYPSAFPSASALRQTLKISHEALCDTLSGFVPEKSVLPLSNAKTEGLGPVYPSNIEKEIISFFRMLTPSEIIERAVSRSRGGDHIAEDGCGILERVCRTAKSADTIEYLLTNSYNSKYTDARINRVILFSLFGVSDKLARSLPKYTTLLGSNENGCMLLAQIRKSLTFNIVTKPADAPKGDPQTIISVAADAMYSSAFPQNKGSDYFFKKGPSILK